MTREGRSRRPAARTAGDPEAPPAPPEPLTRQKLEHLALTYLNRFDCTAKKLRQYLTLRARKAGAGEAAAPWIDDLCARYLDSGVLDDARFARNLSSQLSLRGKSSRAISQKLAARGVPSEVTEELLSARKQDEPEAELEAARAYVRKRRLGTYRAPEEREARRHKDLASLARQGFSFDIARRALGPGPGTEEEF